MNKVIVKSGGNIQGSLISDNVTINEKCDMKDCIVGMGKRVEAEGNYNQTININEYYLYLIPDYKQFYSNSYISGEYRNEVLATDDSEMMEI